MKNYAELQPYQQRVMEEADELAERLRKLTSFVDIGNPIFEALPRDEQSRLRQQFFAMQLLAMILQSRIDHF
jgi:hypothetical protein